MPADQHARFRRTATLILLTGVLSFATSPILVRLAGTEAEGQAVAVWRTAFAVLFLVPFAVVRIGPEIRHFDRRTWGLILLAGVLLGIHFVAWIEALYHTTVASATVIISASPLFLAVLGYLWLRERIEPPVVAAIVLAVAGASLIGLGDAADETFPRALFGNGLALFACFVFALYLLIGRVVRQQVSWLAYVFPLYVAVSLTTLAFALASGVPVLGYSPRFYLLCALMALLPQICGHGSLNFAVRFFPSALIGLATLLEPVGASIAAVFLFQEVPSPIALVGLSIVLVSVTFVFLPPLLRWRDARGRAG